MSDGNILQAGSLNNIADLANVTGKRLWFGSGTGIRFLTNGSDTIQVLTADRNTSNEPIKLVTVLVDSLLQRRNLILESSLARRGPEAKEEAGLGANGSRNSRDRVVGGTSLLLTKWCQ